MKIFKKLFCKHDYKYTGKQHMLDTGMRKALYYECNKCGKIKVIIIWKYFLTQSLQDYIKIQH